MSSVLFKAPSSKASRSWVPDIGQPGKIESFTQALHQGGAHRGIDAGHGGMEMGTFAHRVLEVTHRELLLRALEAGGAKKPGEERRNLSVR